MLGNHVSKQFTKVIIIVQSNRPSKCYAMFYLFIFHLIFVYFRVSDVIGRGFSGYTTRGIRAILPDMLNKDDYEKAACVVILLGSNDCVDNRSFQHVPKELFKDNLNWIIDYIKGQGVSSDKIVLMTPPVYNHDDWAKKQGYPPNLPERHPEGYANISKQVAEETQAESLDLYSITKNHPDYRSLLSDGLHLNEAGAKVVFDSLWPLVYNRIVAFHGSFVQKFPPYDEIEKSLNKDWKE